MESIIKRNLINYLMAKQKLKDMLKLRNTLGDKIVVSDQILIYEGTPQKHGKLIACTKGHIVGVGLISIVNLISCGVFGGTTSPYYVFGLFRDWAGKSTYMRLGTGGGVTQCATTALSSPEPTAPSTQGGSTSNPVGGSYRITWTATWNAGVLPQITISEIGLFGNLIYNANTLQAFGWAANPDSTIDNFLFSRISSADGDFTAFVVNTSVPLTIEWRLTISFA